MLLNYGTLEYMWWTYNSDLAVQFTEEWRSTYKDFDDSPTNAKPLFWIQFLDGQKMVWGRFGGLYEAIWLALFSSHAFK